MNFLIGVLIFAIFMFIVFLVWNKLYMNTTYFKNIAEFENTSNKSTSIPTDLDIVNFGSVFGRFAFEYEQKDKGYNFAMSPQSLTYDYRILTEYIDHINSNAIVVITLPVCIFALTDYKEDARNVKYYSFLSSKNILNYSRWKAYKYCKFPVLNAGKNALHVIKDSKPRNYLTSNIADLDYDKADINAKNRCVAWCKQFGLKDTVCPDLPAEVLEDMEKEVKVLNDMIQLCLDHRLQPVLVSTPFSAALNKYFSKEFVQSMLYNNINKANTAKIPYFDYREHPDFQEKYKWFINGCDWLTKDGRDHFMKIFKDDIKSLRTSEDA